MLSSKLKLKKKDIDFLIIDKKGELLKVIRNNYFDAKVFKENVFIKNKASVIISSKTFKKATERNKIKRKYYSILKKILKLKLKKNINNINFIFYPKKEVFNIKFFLLEKEVYNELNKINFFLN